MSLFEVILKHGNSKEIPVHFGTFRCVIINCLSFCPLEAHGSNFSPFLTSKAEPEHRINVACYEHIDIEPLYVSQGFFNNFEGYLSEAEKAQSIFGLLNPVKKLEKLKEWLSDNTTSLSEKIKLLEEAHSTLQAQIEATTQNASPKLSPRVFPTAAKTTTATTTRITTTESTFPHTSAEQSENNEPLPSVDEFFEDFRTYMSSIPNLLEDGPQLKSGSQRYGPPISVFGATNFKTIFIIEHIIKERAVYTAAAKPTPKQEANNKVAMLNFYEKPIPGLFERQIWICKFTDVFERWVIMGKACDSNKGQYMGYTGFVAKFDFKDTTGKHPTLFGRVASNKGVGMPWAHRFWNEAMPNEGNSICCKGDKFQGFKPCCHYRWWPWAFQMPAGWGTWNEWGPCQNGVRVRFRPCNGLKGHCKAFWGESKSKTPWKETSKCPQNGVNPNAGRMLGPVATKPPTTTRRVVITTRRPVTTRRTTPKPTRTQKWTPKVTVTKAPKLEPYTTRAWHGSGWSPWSNWTKCSRTCGGGIQFRERTCSKNCPQNRGWHQEPKNCGMVQCAPGHRSRWGVWTEWGHCDR